MRNRRYSKAPILVPIGNSQETLEKRFNRSKVKWQLGGLLRPSQPVGDVFVRVEAWFERLKEAPHLRPRFWILPGELTIDGVEKRVMLSAYREWGDKVLVPVGMNYGVYIKQSLIEALGGSEIVSRMIALGGIQMVLEAGQQLDGVGDVLDTALADLEATVDEEWVQWNKNDDT